MELCSLYNLLYQRRSQFNMKIIMLEHPPVKGTVSTVPQAINLHIVTFVLSCSSIEKKEILHFQNEIHFVDIR